MKNLANCTPTEFLVQTNKIRKAVSKWLSITKIMEIRKNIPELSETMTKEERTSAIMEQASKNLSKILDAAMDEHPAETVQLLGLLCFVEPEDVDNHPVKEYLACLTDLMNCQEVIAFFTSLVSLEQTGTSSFAKTSV